MKPMFYFFLVLTTVSAVTASPGKPVLDIVGDIIFNGSYYVLPRIFGPGGGGLTLATLDGYNCPRYIGQETTVGKMGIPVKFSDWKTKVAYVPESANLNIEMDVKAKICSRPTYWHVYEARPDVDDEATFIASDRKSLNDFFQIKKIEDPIGGYKIMFCYGGTDCYNVGIFVDQLGVHRLALASKPFEVMFVKATETTKTLSKPMSII
ncbi:hypothetical protein N665_0476s0016 [Sinapis alba]|nr:hypothetical protein N665_0476s0016 [Sinapis alba]